ncbi:MAG: DUF192 domain-containing protein [Bacteroidota bacterium]|nr:DUF192 domain-containing protein [Bacteroidota bacterium]
MAKESKKKAPQEIKSNNTSKYILIASIILIAGYFVYTTFVKKNETINIPVAVDPKERIKNIKEPQFMKQGELEFIKKDGTAVKKIEIEIADNDDKRSQGLMYRRSMDEGRGMLFLFDRESPQGFWMKNTVIPLDIIYVNSKKEIVKIYKNTIPFSEKDLPSEKPTLYVVEVIGGFTDKYGIKEGDKINYLKL